MDIIPGRGGRELDAFLIGQVVNGMHSGGSYMDFHIRPHVLHPSTMWFTIPLGTPQQLHTSRNPGRASLT